MKKWLVGVLGAVVGSLVVAWVTGVWNPVKSISGLFSGSNQASEQYEVAKDLARKYYFFFKG